MHLHDLKKREKKKRGEGEVASVNCRQSWQVFSLIHLIWFPAFCVETNDFVISDSSAWKQWKCSLHALCKYSLNGFPIGIAALAACSAFRPLPA